MAFGTLSLVIGPVTWLAEGGSLADAMAAADLGVYAVRGQPARSPGSDYRGAGS